MQLCVKNGKNLNYSVCSVKIEENWDKAVTCKQTETYKYQTKHGEAKSYQGSTDKKIRKQHIQNITTFSWFTINQKLV